MKEIRNNIEKLKEEISTIDKSEYKSIFNNISSNLEGLRNKIEEVMVNRSCTFWKLKVYGWWYIRNSRRIVWGSIIRRARWIWIRVYRS